MAKGGTVTVKDQESEVAVPKLPKKRGNWQPPARQDKDFDLLAAMRHCLNNPGACDETAGERACREWMKKSPGGFMEEFNRLSALAAPKAGPAGEKAEEPVDEDEADAEVEAAIVELLKRMASPH